jgi:hypothetical protein
MTMKEAIGDYIHKLKIESGIMLIKLEAALPNSSYKYDKPHEVLKLTEQEVRHFRIKKHKRGKIDIKP